MGKARNIADAEQRFVNTAGDTMTGTLKLPSLSVGGTANAATTLDVQTQGANVLTSVLTTGIDDLNFRMGAMNGVAGGTGTSMAKLGLFYLGTGESSTIDFIRGGGATDGAIAFRSAGTERMRIRADGSRWTDANALPAFECRAWVNFNGTTTPPTIRASGNVSSVTRNATGSFTVNFTTAMPDVNYSGLLTTEIAVERAGTRTTTGYSFTVESSGGNAFNPADAHVAIFR